SERHLRAVRQRGPALKTERSEGRQACGRKPRGIGFAIVSGEYEHGVSSAILHRQSVVVAEAEERRGGREIMPYLGVGAIDLEQLDEVFCSKLRKTVRKA